MSNAAEQGIADGTFQCPTKLQQYIGKWLQANNSSTMAAAAQTRKKSSLIPAVAEKKRSGSSNNNKKTINEGPTNHNQQHPLVSLPSALEMVFDTTGKYKGNSTAAAAATTSAGAISSSPSSSSAAAAPYSPKGTAILYHSKVTRHRRHAAQGDYDRLAEIFNHRRILLDRLMEEVSDEMRKMSAAGATDATMASIPGLAAAFPFLSALFANDASLYEVRRRGGINNCHSAHSVDGASYPSLSSTSTTLSPPNARDEVNTNKGAAAAAPPPVAFASSDFLHQQLINTILWHFRRARDTILAHQEASVRRCIRVVDGDDTEHERPERVERTWEHLLACGLPQSCGLKCYAAEEDAAYELGLVGGGASNNNTNGATAVVDGSSSISSGIAPASAASSFKLQPAKTKVLQLVHDRDHIDMVDDYSIQLERARLGKINAISTITTAAEKRIRELLLCDADDTAEGVSDFLFRKILQNQQQSAAVSDAAAAPTTITTTTANTASASLMTSLKPSAIEALRLELAEFYHLVLLDAAEGIATRIAPLSNSSGLVNSKLNANASMTASMTTSSSSNLNCMAGSASNLAPEVQPFGISVGQDLYASKGTAQAARLAAGGVVHLALEICKPDSEAEAMVDRMPATAEDDEDNAKYDDEDEAQQQHTKSSNKKKKRNNNQKSTVATKKKASAAAATPTNYGVIDGSPADLRTAQNGFALVRPPGHHSGTERAAGFCFFNSVAVAARAAQSQYPNRIKKVLIIDWDVHHGDGTEQIFTDDPSVMCFSVHQFGNKLGHVVRKRSSVANALAKAKAANAALRVQQLKEDPYFKELLRSEAGRVLGEAVMTRHLMSPPATPDSLRGAGMGGGGGSVGAVLDDEAIGGGHQITQFRRKRQRDEEREGTAATRTAAADVVPQQQPTTNSSSGKAAIIHDPSLATVPALTEDDVLAAMMAMDFEEAFTAAASSSAAAAAPAAAASTSAPTPDVVVAPTTTATTAAAVSTPSDAAGAGGAWIIPPPPASPPTTAAAADAAVGRRTRNKDHLLAAIKEAVAKDEAVEAEAAQKQQHAKEEEDEKKVGDVTTISTGASATAAVKQEEAAVAAAAPQKLSLAEEMAAINASGRRTRPKAIVIPTAADDNNDEALPTTGEQPTAIAAAVDGVDAARSRRPRAPVAVKDEVDDNDNADDALLAYFGAAQNAAANANAKDDDGEEESGSRSDMATTDDDDDDAESDDDDELSDTTSSADASADSHDSFVLPEINNNDTNNNGADGDGAAAKADDDNADTETYAGGSPTSPLAKNQQTTAQQKQQQQHPLTRVVLKDKRTPKLNHSGWVSNTEDYDDYNYHGAHRTAAAGGGNTNSNKKGSGNASKAALTAEIMRKHNGNINHHVFAGDGSGKGSNASEEDDRYTFNESRGPSLASLPSSLFIEEAVAAVKTEENTATTAVVDAAAPSDDPLLLVAGTANKPSTTGTTTTMGQLRLNPKYEGRLLPRSALLATAANASGVGSYLNLNLNLSDDAARADGTNTAAVDGASSPSSSAPPPPPPAALLLADHVLPKRLENVHPSMWRFAQKREAREPFYPGTGAMDVVGAEAPSGRWVKKKDSSRNKNTAGEKDGEGEKEKKKRSSPTAEGLVESDDENDNASSSSNNGDAHDNDDADSLADIDAAGRTVNAPWPCHGFGDIEYLQLFHSLLLPMIDEFEPDLIIVACGFDAAKEDNLGAMQMTPSGYYYLTRLIMKSFEARRQRWEAEQMALRQQVSTSPSFSSQLPSSLPPVPRLVVALEGGYNLKNVALGSEAVLRALVEESKDGEAMAAKEAQRAAFEQWVGRRHKYNDAIRQMQQKELKRSNNAAAAKKNSAAGGSKKKSGDDDAAVSPAPIVSNDDPNEPSFGLAITKEHLTEANHPDKADPSRARIHKKARYEERLKELALIPPPPPLPATGVPIGPHAARNRMLVAQCKSVVAKVQEAQRPYWDHLRRGQKGKK